MAALALDNDIKWRPEETEEGLIVPECGGAQPPQEHVLPRLDDFSRWLKEKGATESRIAEIDEILPD